MAESDIEWTDKTWNPTIGCARVSAGCESCYAETQAARVALMERGQGRPSPYLAVVDVERRRWNRRAVFLPERLGEPLKWRKPARIFVDSMSDLFHEDITFDQIAAVFGVMAATPRHTYQVLTKRPARMLEFFHDDGTADLIAREASFRSGVIWDSRGSNPANYGMVAGPRADAIRIKDRRPWVWPLPNVHIGVSVEDQRAADERIPLLRQCPAALRFLSVEPLLGPVDLLTPSFDGSESFSAMGRIGWVIVGGESGPGARPCAVEWIRGVVRQCRTAGVPVFVKQLGSCPVAVVSDIVRWPRRTAYSLPVKGKRRVREAYVHLRDRKGGDPSEWPADLRVREFPEVKS